MVLGQNKKILQLSIPLGSSLIESLTDMDWNQVVEDLGAPLYRYFSASSLTTFRADDLVQEVFLRLVRSVENGNFDPAKGSLRMFAFGVAHYVRLEAFHSNFETLPLNEEVVVQQPSRTDSLDLRRAVHSLPEEQKQIVLLVIENDLTFRERSTF